MAIMNFLRSLFKKRPTPQPMEYIEETPDHVQADDPKDQMASYLREMENEIDLSRHQDLEDYARGLSVTKESIERWISSGLLMPDEMKVAEKIIKIMRES